MKLFPKSSSAGYATDGGPDILFFETTSVTSEQSCDAPISKEESQISDRIFGHFTTIPDYFRRFPKAIEDPRRVPKISERSDYCRRCPKNLPNT